MIKRHSDVVLELTAHDPDTVENDLNEAWRSPSNTP